MFFSFAMDKVERHPTLVFDEWIIKETEDKIIYENTMPEKIEDDYFLSFITKYQTFQITINHNTVFDNSPKNYFNNMPTNELVRIPFHSHNELNTIQIIITKNNHEKQPLPEISIDCEKHFWSNHFSSIFFPTLITSLLCIIGIFLFLYGLQNRNSISNKSSFLYLGLFSFFSGLLAFVSNPYTTIYLGKLLFTTTCEYLINIILFFSFLIFLKKYLKIYSKTYIYIYTLSLISCITILILHFSGIFNLYESRIFIILLTMIGATYSLKQFYNNMKVRNSVESKSVFFSFSAFYILLVFKIIGDMIIHNLQIIPFYYLGALIFLITICILLIIDSINEININLLKKYAFYDELTNIRNRTAYFNDIKTLSGNIVLCVLDVNYLKQINDEFGHLAGDQLLKDCVSCLNLTFQNYSHELYRIGGDEFVAILKADENNLNMLQKKLAITSTSFNKTSIYPVSIASGFVSFFLKKPNPELIEQYFKEADNKMYENKKKLHKKKK